MSPPKSRHRQIPLPQIGEHPDLASLLVAWRGDLAQGLRRVDPMSVPRKLLPYALLMDVKRGNPVCLRVRLAGTMLCEIWGGELKGRVLADILRPADVAAFMAYAKVATDEMRPLLLQRDDVWFRRYRLSYASLLLPFAAGNSRPAGLLETLDPGSLELSRATSDGWTTL